jgi:HEAT repeat protein
VARRDDVDAAPHPHERIRADVDRSWTERLLGALASPATTVEEREATIQTLSCLDDPRAIVPLTSLLEDPAASLPAREAAAEVLWNSAGVPDDPAQRHRWWRSGDPLLARVALERMDRGDADLVAAVASDPEHPLLHSAIARLHFDFDEARFVQMTVAALGHASLLVRRAAAVGLAWNHPVAGEEAALRALRDSDEQVAREAAEALAGYPTLRTFDALRAVRDGDAGGDGPASLVPAVQSEVERALDSLARRCLGALAAGPPPVTAWLRAWLQTIWPWLYRRIDAVAAGPPRGPRPTAPARPVPDAAALREALAELDGPWLEKRRLLDAIDWAGYAATDRAALGAVLSAHPDILVRRAGCEALAIWNDRDRLLGLLDDPCFSVRKRAAHALGERSVARSPEVVARLWRQLHAPATVGSHARETLKSWAAHAGAAAVPALLELACGDRREEVRTQAIELVVDKVAGRADGGAAAAARSGFPDVAAVVLARPPEVTWAVHLAVLEACRRLGVASPPAADALRAVDHLDVQRGLALLLTR